MMERFGAAALLKSINGMLVIDKDEEYESKSYTFGGLPELMREFGQQTAGAADMPYTLLFGQTTSGLNNSGEFDLRSYYDRVNTEQNWTLRPILERIFPVIFKSLFGMIPTGFNFVFYPLWQLDVKTRSEVEKNNTERDIKYLEKGIITEAMIAKQLQQDGTYDFLDDDHIKALEGLVGQIDDNTNQA
jgi:phage-related protein (TIGR01555 family)